MKKKILWIFSAFTITTGLYAQEITPNDILKYNNSDLNGTARFKAMSGAFGALGGDLSALKINPAGGAVFNYNNAAFSLSFVDKSNKSTYLNSKSKDSYSGLDLGQLGALFVFNNHDQNALFKKFTIGINFESTSNMRNNVYFDGINNDNSLGDYFLQTANVAQMPKSIVGIEQGDIRIGYSDAGYYGGFAGQQTYLGFHGYLISPIEGQEGKWSADYNTTAPHRQSRSVATSGGTNLFSGNFATQMGDKFYIGANLNLHIVDYTQISSAYQITEQQTMRSEIIRFDNYQYTYGTGFSFNIGAIAKLTQSLRAGLAYESPTWYALNDETSQGISTQIGSSDGQSVYPDVVNVWERYNLRTPSKYTASLAYVFGQKALLSIDYAIKDYSNNKYKTSQGDIYNYLNEQTKATMGAASEVRIGGEYKINELSLRAGYRFEQSPYKKIKYESDLNSFSFGVGYDFGASKLDLGYSFTAKEYKTNYVDMSYNNLYEMANIKVKENWINLTYSIKF